MYASHLLRSRAGMCGIMLRFATGVGIRSTERRHGHFELSRHGAPDEPGTGTQGMKPRKGVWVVLLEPLRTVPSAW
ncbi:hypothetical protein B2J93_3509 [Marssonina coronariae]|uniref:Uncharacterized protein n=1 Tax=Diplocarpon coronariae TaxID=2795749 RepID=A0A218Z4E7_9HELO|nr:hypothetical protein B2J93_3509 [Marssonina coronariae]